MLTRLVWLGGFIFEASVQVDSLRRVGPETSRGTDAVGDALSEAVADIGPPGASGGEKKNYTEKISAALTTLVAARLRELGLREARAPQRGRDKQFMGGYGTKGVDAYVSDEKHGLLLSSGTKGILFDVRKNLKNRYRDMVAAPPRPRGARWPRPACSRRCPSGGTEYREVAARVGLLVVAPGRHRLPDRVDQARSRRRCHGTGDHKAAFSTTFTFSCWRRSS